MNEVIVSGKIRSETKVYRGQDDEISYMRFSLGRSRKRGNEWVAEYYDVTCFPPLVELVNKYLRYNDRIVVIGRLSQNAYQNDEGKTIRRWNIVAGNILISLLDYEAWLAAADSTEEEEEGGEEDE